MFDNKIVTGFLMSSESAGQNTINYTMVIYLIFRALLTLSKRICGQCPETIVTSTNQIQVLLQADAGDDPGLSRKFALRLEKTLG